MEQAFEMEREAVRARNAEVAEARREQREREREADRLEKEYFSLTRDRAASRELGRYWAGVSDKPLSPAAAALDRRLKQAGDNRMAKAAGLSVGGRSSGAGKAALQVLRELEAAKGERIQLEQRGDIREDERRRVMTRIDKAVGALRRFPGQLQGGVDANGWPWGQYWDGNQFVGLGGGVGSSPTGAPPQAQETVTLAELQEIARRQGKSLEEVRAQAEAEGLVVR